MATTTTDRIERQIQLRQPRSRVWRALTDFKEFNAWFGVELEGPFKAGGRVKGRITHKGYEHMTMDIVVERIEPEHAFAWRWHPGAKAPGESFESEPMTLVVFTLEDAPGGTLLKVVETGFDAIPIARRAKALKENEGGWTGQMKAIEAYLARAAG